jgi:cation transport ATPase
MNKITILLLFIVMGNLTGNAQSYCPYGGKVDCPGECELFTDNNGDGFCDHGKLSKESKPAVDTATKATTATATDKSAANHAKSTSTSTSSGSEKETQINSSINLSQQNDNEEIKAQKTEQIAQGNPAQPMQTNPIRKRYYHLFELSIALLLLYLISVLLAKYRVYTMATHRKIWNSGLAISFLISCIIGLLMTYFINVRSFPTYYRSLVLYHVEFGIAMTIIAIFHMVWHWRYFFNLFKSKKQKANKLAK